MKQDFSKMSQTLLEKADKMAVENLLQLMKNYATYESVQFVHEQLSLKARYSDLMPISEKIESINNFMDSVKVLSQKSEQLMTKVETDTKKQFKTMTKLMQDVDQNITEVRNNSNENNQRVGKVLDEF